MNADDITYKKLDTVKVTGGVIFDEDGNQFHFTIPTMKSFLIGDTIYKYIADTWVQAEKMLADELGVSVWELPSFKFTRYEL